MQTCVFWKWRTSSWVVWMYLDVPYVSARCMRMHVLLFFFSWKLIAQDTGPARWDHQISAKCTVPAAYDEGASWRMSSDALLGSLSERSYYTGCL